MKPRQLVLLAVLAIAAGLVFFGDKTQEADLVEPLQPLKRSTSAPASPAIATTDANPQQTKGSATFNQGESAVMVRALKARAMLISGANDRQGGPDLFSSKSWEPPPQPKKAENIPPPAPTAPPLPFTYLGNQAGDGHLEAYLSRGEKIFVVREHSVIDGAYRVESIVPQKLTLTYLPLNQVQNLSIGIAE